MKKYVIDGGFGLDNLNLIEAEKPVPGPGQVLLKVFAVSLNYRDLMMVEGTYNPKQPLPLVPCSDGVGEIEAVGEGVTRFNVGDRVCTTFFDNWVDGVPRIEEIRGTRGGPIDGTLAEYTLVSESALVKMPEHLLFEEAATLTCAGVTAWTAMFTLGNVRPGSIVLLLGTGGVSTFGLQFAKMSGAEVIVTSSNNRKLERAKELGADAVINYVETPNWGREAKNLTQGRGVDLVLEVGGAGTLNQSIAAMAPGGQISLIGVLSGAITDVNLAHVFRAEVKIQGIFVGHRQSFENMARAITSAQMHPHVDRSFPLEQARDAFAYLKSQQHQGKVVVRVQ